LGKVPFLLVVLNLPIEGGSCPEDGGMKAGKTRVKVEANNVRKIREGLLMSKAELARRAGLSVLTIDRVEKGMTCRMDTKRKIILSLGLQLSDRDKVFSKKD
jgi:DNA-binding XRE family transcriptional regulator